MKAFMDEQFLLETETAQKLFHDTAENLPIVDFHNHLNPREIYEDVCYDNMTQVWLGGDHYKWRAMRANGIPEKLITGDGDPYEKFLAWADTVQNCMGNPLYHWTHLELQRYFGITTPLSPKTAPAIWEECNQKLHTKEYSVRNLLRMQKVEVLCTTDDPLEDLSWHEKLMAEKEQLGFSVLPTFRPEKAMNLESPAFGDYIRQLSAVSGCDTSTFSGLLQALEQRLDFFVQHGCCITDHSLEKQFFQKASEEEADKIYRAVLAGHTPSEEEAGIYRGQLLVHLGALYSERNLAMQLHIGALRNTASRYYTTIGPDVGCDTLNDFAYAPSLAALLDAMDSKNQLPRTILYYLNPKDAPMLAVMAGNFQENEQGIRGKVQLGSAWWFCDHKNGMEQQMDALADAGLLSAFIGMLTDSRSFLSFPRHEYFRRILCNKVGKWVENGEYPADMEYLKKMITDICHDNVVRYLGKID